MLLFLDSTVVCNYKVDKATYQTLKGKIYDPRHVVLQGQEGETVVLRGPKITAVEVEPTDEVEKVMKRMEDLEGIPADQQRLVFKGTQLDPRRRLSDYNLQNEDVLDLVLRLRD